MRCAEREREEGDLVKFWEVVIRHHGEGMVFNVVVHIPVDEGRDCRHEWEGIIASGGFNNLTVSYVLHGHLG